MILTTAMVLGCVLISTMARADSVILNNGSTYYGKLTAMDDAQVILHDAYGIEMRIPRGKVKRIVMGDGEVKEPAQPISPVTAAAPTPVLKGGEMQAMFPQLGDQKTDPSKSYQKVTLAQVLSLPDGTALTVQGRYGRLKASASGVPQSNFSWYLNDGKQELRVNGRVPYGISSYSRDQWGSVIEVKGVLQRKGERVFLKGQSSTLVRRSISRAPDNY